jgi:hypothetical protein
MSYKSKGGDKMNNMVGSNQRNDGKVLVQTASSFDSDRKRRKGVFDIIVINKDEDVILKGHDIIAEGIEDIKAKADVYTKLKKNDLLPSEVNFIITVKGEIEVEVGA